ncbi:MAG: alanyl-tRNA editing protein [Bacillota bacterium]
MNTERLFHQDAYQTAFTGRVQDQVLRQGRWAVELDRTAFYATAGGQPHDTGRLSGFPVVDVTEEDDRILHWLDAAGEQPPLAQGAEVQGEIDWPRRLDHMQQHSGQHILSGAFWRLLQAETVSFHMGSESSTIDLDAVDLGTEDVAQATRLANQVLWENRPIRVHWADTAEEASRLPLRKPPKVLTGVRVVEVDGFDFSACGGTHPHSAGEVGVIVARRWERYKGGTRVEFLCGGRALRDYEQQNAVGWELNRLLSVGVPELPQAVARLQEQAAEARRQWEKARSALLEQEAESLWRQGEPLAGEGRLVLLNLGDRPMEEAKALAGVLCRHPLTVALLGTAAGGRAQLLFQRSPDLALDLNQLLRSVLPLLEGRGGGQPGVAQGGGPRVEALGEALRTAAEALRRG